MPKRPYHPNDVVQNFNTNIKLKPFLNEKDIFDDLFEGVDKFTDVLKIASNKLSEGDFKFF